MIVAGRNGEKDEEDKLDCAMERVKDATVVAAGARCRCSTILTMSLALEKQCERTEAMEKAGVHVRPFGHRTHADVTTREILPDRSRDDVAQLLLDDLKVSGRERMSIHVGVHRWKEVGRGGWIQGAEEGGLECAHA